MIQELRILARENYLYVIDGDYIIDTIGGLVMSYRIRPVSPITIPMEVNRDTIMSLIVETDIILINVTDCQIILPIKDNAPSLANDIREYGQLQPIIVIDRETHFQVVDGVRRLKALIELDWPKIYAKRVLK